MGGWVRVGGVLWVGECGFGLGWVCAFVHAC